MLHISHAQTKDFYFKKKEKKEKIVENIPLFFPPIVETKMEDLI